MIRLQLKKHVQEIHAHNSTDTAAFAAARSSTVATTRKPFDTNIRSFPSEEQADGSLASLAHPKAQRDITSANSTTNPETVAAAMTNELMGEEEEEMELFFADCC